MAYVAVDKDGMELKFSKRPVRHHNGVTPLWTSKGMGTKAILSKGSIAKLIGRTLTWDDEPVELKEE